MPAPAAGVEGLPYLVFLAPGLLAATAMQTGAGEVLVPGDGRDQVDQELPGGAGHTGIERRHPAWARSGLGGPEGGDGLRASSPR